MEQTTIDANRADPVIRGGPAGAAGPLSRGEAIGQATLRGLAAVLFSVLAAATRPVEGSADTVATEPADHGPDDDVPRSHRLGLWAAGCVAMSAAEGSAAG